MEAATAKIALLEAENANLVRCVAAIGPPAAMSKAVSAPKAAAPVKKAVSATASWADITRVKKQEPPKPEPVKPAAQDTDFAAIGVKFTDFFFS